jgi:predicted nucleotidyltransferase
MVTETDLLQITKLITSHTFVKKIIIFGSYVRNSMTKDSDIDICIIIDNNQKDIYKIMQSFYMQLAAILKLPFDLIVENEEHFYSRSSLPTIERTIMQEGKVIYAA